MICSKCGTTLNDNAKFCKKCGNPISVSDIPIADAYAEQQPNNMADFVQQPINSITNPSQEMPYNANITGAIEQKDKTIKIVGGIVIAVLVVALIFKSNENSQLKNDIARYEDQIYQYEDKIYQYENENVIEKTIDAVGSWVDFLY